MINKIRRGSLLAAASVKQNESIPNNMIFYTSSDQQIVEPYRNDFGANLVSNTYTDGKGQMVFDGDITHIGDNAFDGRRLTSIQIPNSVTNIGDEAFWCCTSLTSAVIGNSVTSIGELAFSECESLTSIEIPNSVTSIGNYAFYLCTSLTSIEIPNSVTSIGYGAFSECNSLTNIQIPNSVTSIGNGVFDGCSNLTSVIIGNSVTSIGNSAFIGCYNLTSIVVDAGNSKYDSRNGCNAIIETASNTLIAGCKNTIIPNSVTSIGDEAFYYCKSLTSIQIPNSVTSIGDDAFYGCRSLTSVYVKSTTPPSLGSTVFNDNASSRKIYVPRASLNAYKTASGWSSYKDAIEPYFTP